MQPSQDTTAPPSGATTDTAEYDALLSVADRRVGELLARLQEIGQEIAQDPEGLLFEALLDRFHASPRFRPLLSAGDGAVLSQLTEQTSNPILYLAGLCAGGVA